MLKSACIVAPLHNTQYPILHTRRRIGAPEQREGHKWRKVIYKFTHVFFFPESDLTSKYDCDGFRRVTVNISIWNRTYDSAPT